MMRPKPFLFRYVGLRAPSVLEGYLRVERRLRRLVGGPSGSAAATARDLPRFGAAEVERLLTELGIVPGDVVMIHSAWDALKGYEGTPIDLLRLLRARVGESGTLCAPAYPQRQALVEGVYDVRRTPSGAGLLSEMLRRLPGARRSYQQRAVAAVGPHAEYLTRDHHLSPYPSDEFSPYVRLAELGGKVLCLGVGPETNTMFHAGEDVLKSDFPVDVYQGQKGSWRVRTETGTLIEVESYWRVERWTYCCDGVRMLPYFGSIIRDSRLGGIPVYLIDAAPFLDRLLSLARRGVHMYGFRFPRLQTVALPAPKLGAAPVGRN